MTLGGKDPLPTNPGNGVVYPCQESESGQGLNPAGVRGRLQ